MVIKRTKKKEKKHERELLTNAQTREGAKSPTMITKNKINVFCLQSSIG